MHAVGGSGHGNVIPLTPRIGEIVKEVLSLMEIEPGVPHVARALGAPLVEHRLNAGVERRFRLGFAHEGLGIPRSPEVTAAIKDQLAVGNARIAIKPRRREGLHHVLGLAVFKRPPSQRERVGGPVWPQGRKLIGIERAVVDTGILNGSAEEANLAHRADVAQPQQDHRVIAKGLRLTHRIGGVFPAVPKQRDSVAVIGDGNLDQRIWASTLRRPGRLVIGRAAEEVASGHPPARGDFAEHDCIETLRLVDQGQHTAASLVGVSEGNAGHERFVAHIGWGRRFRSARPKGQRASHDVDASVQSLLECD